MATANPKVANAQMYTQSSVAAWLQAFTNSLVACGMTQTSDTGQINTTSPPTSNYNSDTVLGYQVYKFSDSLQSTAPVFIRVAHGTGNSYGPALWINVGQGTDGAGNLTGVRLPGNGIELSSNQGTNTGLSAVNQYYSGSSNRIAFDLQDDPTYGGVMFFASIERTHDANGNDTADGVILFTHSDRGGPNSVVIPSSGSVCPSPQYGWPCAINRLGSNTNGSSVGVLSPIPFGFRAYNPPIGVMVYQATDLAPYSQNSLSAYGSSHNYQACGRVGYVVPRQEQGYGNNNGINSDASGGTRILMRYE